MPINQSEGKRRKSLGEQVQVIKERMEKRGGEIESEDRVG